MYNPDQFKRGDKKEDLVKRFPVALKPSDSSTHAEKPEWVKVIVEDNEDESEMGVDLENVTTLHAQQKVQWMSLLLKLLSLGDSTLWRILVLIQIAVNFVQVSYAYIFLRDSSNKYAYYSIVVCDAMYAIDFAMAVTIYFWRNLQLRLVNPPRNKATLVCDCFLVLPYSFIYEMIYKDNNTVMFIILRSVSFLRLFHLVRFFREKSNSAGTNHWKYFIMQYFMYFFLLQHGLACIWYLLACPLGCKLPGGWAAVLNELNRYPETHLEWYLTCMYFSLINITTVGFGDVIATNTAERIVGALTMAFGFTLTTGVFIGTLTSQFVNSSLRQSLMRHQIAAILRHVIAIDLGKDKIQQILSYYYTLWIKKKGVREAEDITLLPKPLRMEICFDVNICLLQCSLIFRDKPESFLRVVSLKMKHEFYQTGEIIFHQHVVKYKMVCVASGVIEILSDEDNESPIISFAAGTCIGESALVLALPARATMRAASYTEVQALYKKDFFSIIELYPEFFTSIRLQILERVEDAKQHSAKFEENREIVTLSLYVPHNRQLSEIKKLKDRLNPKTAYTFNSTDTFYRKCLPMYRFSQNVRKAKCKHICLSAKFPWIMQPETSLTSAWEILIIINTSLIGILYPYYIAFHRGFPPWLDAASIILELINLIDIYMILTTAIVEKDRTIDTFKGILFKKLDTIGFYFDIFSAFYIEVFAYILYDSDHWFYILKLNRMLKMYRIVQFFRHLEANLTAKLVRIRLIKYPIYLIMCPYWFGAILYIETCFNEVCDENGWFHTKLIEELEDRLIHPCTENVVHISVYYALTCLSGLGYGDITSGNLKDLITVACGILIGIFIFGYCTAEFSATFTHNLKKKTDFQETLYAVKNFMKDNHMPSEIKNRVLNFFVLQWQYNEGVGVTNKQSLFYNATWKIQQDVLVKERMETITSVPLFYDTDLDFLQLIATGSRVIVLPPNEMVTYAGGLSREMYIIQKGYCEQQTSNGEFQVIGPLAHFGSASLLYGKSSLTTVRTITHVKLISIEVNIFTRAISMFPTIGKVLHNVGEDLELVQKLKLISTNTNTNISHKKIYDRSIPHWDKLKKFCRDFKDSFVYVPNYCKKSGEDYSTPFRELDNLRWFKYLLMPFCILPDSHFIKFWITIRLTTACLVCFLTPYQFIQSPYIPLLDRILFSLDFIAYLDLLIMMMVGYYGDKKQLIIHPLKTTSHYLKGLFGIDFILCFPWELIIKLLLRDHNEGHSDFAHSLAPHIYHCLFRSLRIFQIYRLPQAFQYLENDITKKGDVLQVFKFVPFTVMFVNLWACIVVVTSCKYYHISDFDRNIIINRSAQPSGMTEQIVYEYTMWCREDSWIDRSKYHRYTKPFSVFVTAMYWCTSTMVGSGFGDITAQDKVHLLIVMCMIIFGVLFFGYIYASISSHKAGLHSTLSQYQEMLKELKMFMEYENVDKRMQSNIINYYEYRWKRTGGTEPNIILANLHTALLEDAVLYMYEDTLREVPLFEHVDRSFFRVIGKELRERYFTRGQAIIRANDVIENVFIIYRGKVEVISSYNEMQTYMGIGGLFGNITPQRKTKCNFTITAIKNLDALYVPTERFHDILKRYPTVKKKMDVILHQAEGYIMPTTIISSDSDISYQKKNTTFDDASVIDQITTSKSSGSTAGTTATGSGLGTTPSFALVFLPNKWCRVAILPDDLIFTVYSYISVIAAYTNSIVVTYQFAFQHHSANLLMLAVILDVIFILKIFLDMHKAYIDRYGEYVTDNRKIRTKYFKDKKIRILEFVASIPIYYFTFFLPLFTGLNPYLFFSGLRLITLLRCYYIMEFYKVRSNKLMVNTLYLKISTIIMWITLIVHLFACIWYLFACPLTYCVKQSWLKGLPNFNSKSKFDIYILCFYYIMNVLTTTGTGDILPNNRWEIIYIIIIMIVTKFFIGIFIGDVTSVLNAYTSSLVSYEYGIEELRDYLHNENVSDHQMEKMWRYVRQLWTRSHGKQVPRLVGQLPYVMKYSLMNEVYGPHLRNSYIFSGTEEPFIRQLSVLIDHVIFFPGNYIVQHGDSDQSMYFIHRGEVDILTVHPNLTETIHDILHTGEMFGIAQGLYHGVPHHFSFRARTTVDIMLLQLNKWQDLLKFFPISKELIYRKAENIYIKH